MAKETCKEGPCTEHSGLDARISTVERETSEIKKAILEMRNTLLGRPSWFVCFMFTAMSSMIIGLAIALVLR